MKKFRIFPKGQFKLFLPFLRASMQRPRSFCSESIRCISTIPDSRTCLGRQKAPNRSASITRSSCSLKQVLSSIHFIWNLAMTRSNRSRASLLLYGTFSLSALALLINSRPLIASGRRWAIGPLRRELYLYNVER